MDCDGFIWMGVFGFLDMVNNDIDCWFYVYFIVVYVCLFFDGMI